MNPSRHGISQMIAEIIALAERPQGVTVSECIALLGDRSILLAILILSLLNSLPVPGIPGLSTVTGIPIILLGAQLVLGREKIWLPRRMQAHVIAESKMTRALKRITPYVKKGETYLKPGGVWFASPVAGRVIGVLIMIIAILLALPIPFLNFPCGLTITLLVLGLIVGDDILTAAGLAAVAVCGVIFGLLSATVAQAVQSVF